MATLRGGSILIKRLLNQENKFPLMKFSSSTLPQSDSSSFQVSFTADKRVVELKDKRKNTIYKFPTVWLRDNCQCPKCYHPDTQSRSSLVKNLDPFISFDKIASEGDGVQISWHDNHKSPYSFDWLREHGFSHDPQVENAGGMPWKRSLWDRDFKQPEHKYQDVMNSDSALLNWLIDLEKYGFALVTEAPEEKNTIKTLIQERVGILRSTHYGDHFETVAKPHPNNLAYTASELGLHTDQPYYEYTPGTQFLHCIIQAECAGATNLMCDGFYVANIMKNKYPKEFKTLTDTWVSFFDAGSEDIVGEFKKETSKPVIKLNAETGDYEQISYNDQVRFHQLKLPFEKVQKFYEALKIYNNLSYQNALEIKLRPGDIMTFDNLRVLHGRTSYLTGSSRHLQGGYVDWDEIKSRINVLKDKI